MVLTGLAKAGDSRTDKIDHLYLSIFNRPPRAAERESLQTWIENAGPDAKPWKEIIWSMLNSHEFLFIQ